MHFKLVPVNAWPDTKRLQVASVIDCHLGVLLQFMTNFSEADWIIMLLMIV